MKKRRKIGELLWVYEKGQWQIWQLVGWIEPPRPRRKEKR